MVSFIDSLVKEYKQCQQLLNEKPRPHKAPKSEAIDPHHKAKVLLISVANKSKSDTAINVRPERKKLVPVLSKDGEIPLLNLHFPSYLWDNVEKIMRAFEAGIQPLVSSSHDGEKISYIGEMALQGVMKHETGLHLVIAPESALEDIEYIFLNDVFKEGLYTAWSLLLERKDSKATFDKFAAQFHEHVLYLESKGHHIDDWCYSLFSLMSHFKPEVVFEKLYQKPWLITAILLKKLKSHSIAHFVFTETNFGIPFEADAPTSEIANVTDSILKKLERDATSNDDKSHFVQKLKALHTIADDTMKPLSMVKAIRECFNVFNLRLKEPTHRPLIASVYILASRLLTLDPRRFMIQDAKYYPDSNAAWRVALFSRQQFYCHKSSGQLAHEFSNNSIVVASPNAFEGFNVAKLSQPIRSIQLFGHEKTNPQEWKKMVTLLDQLKAQSQKSPPIIALYCQTADRTLHGYATEKV